MEEKTDIADLKSGYMSLESIDQSKNAPQDIRIELRELAACTIMEEAAAIWKYYKTADEVQELVDYLQVAINSERAKKDHWCDGQHYYQGVYPLGSKRR